ncbi:type II secretion system protein [Candidatus Omnitrophota bacterium]
MRHKKTMQCQEGFTLIEVMIVSVVLGVLFTIGIFHYSTARELIFDQEVASKLKVLQSAQKSYFLDTNSYYPAAGSETSELLITDNLKVILDNSRRVWDYTVWDNGCSRATRNGSNGRSWFLTIDDADEEPDSGAGCP